MRIAEIFRSVQGEGLLTGTESVFIRTSGCNLRCRFCDTPYASWAPEGNEWTVEEILRQVEKLNASHVVLTGGEPMLFDDLVPLTAELHRDGRHITIETAATRYLPVNCDLMSISPKLSNSTPPATDHPEWRLRHEQVRHAPDVVTRLVAEYTYQIKFVVDQPADLPEVEEYLVRFPQIERARVLLMPQGTDLTVLGRKAAWLEPYCAQHGLWFCPRRQIEWFGYRRGT